MGGIAGQIMTKLGVVPQQIAAPDIYPALEKGTIDAAEWVGPYDDEKLGFYKVAKYYYYPGFWEGGPQLSVYVNVKQWEALPKAYQAVFEAAAAQSNIWMLAKYDAENMPALRRLVAGGAILKPFPRDVMEAAYKASFELGVTEVGCMAMRGVSSSNCTPLTRACSPSRPCAISSCFTKSNGKREI